MIVAHYGVAVEVLFSESKEREMIRVKRNSGHVVGDRVVIEGEQLVRQERRTELTRLDARGGRHLVGANLDVLCIVTSCQPEPPPGFIERAIVAARAAGLTPVLAVNKADLPDHGEYIEELREVFATSLDILEVSAASGLGLSGIKKFFSQGHRGIFVGPTGVGKSSILNSLLPHLTLQTGAINEARGRGRNTTTVSTLHQLEGGGELIDSPGFNDFGLTGITPVALASHFPGFEKAAQMGCKFRDCLHEDEPGCAVLELLEAEEIAEERYDMYLYILTEVASQLTQADYRERRHRRKKNG
jgi:ribosome biogenesis GTPase